MSLGASLFLVAVGAILRFAITADLAGIDIQVVGTILMIVGVIGSAISRLEVEEERDRGAAPPL